MRATKPSAARREMLRIATIAILVNIYIFSCTSAGPYQSLAPAQVTGGPTVRCDLTEIPAGIPFPNDLAARIDATSPTGVRLNLPLAGVSALPSLGSDARLQLDQLDGFGTTAPITVSFDGDLDVLDLFERQSNADPSDDAIYLIDLTDGSLQPLDFNTGSFPLELPTPQSYFLDDSQAASTNLLFPSLNQNTNYLHPNDPGWAAAHGGIPQQSDDLLTFYERATRTLILRPMEPLQPRRSYAVVLTSRLHGTGGLAVQSPFAGINHALQTQELSPLRTRLPAGTELSDVAFAWAFTTQSTSSDLELIQQGLEGDGILQPLYLRFPVLDSSVINTGLSRIQVLPEESDVLGSPYTVSSATMNALLADPRLRGNLAPADPAALAALQQSLTYVDYFVSGTFPSPDLLADPDRPADQTAFQLDSANGFIRTTFARVPFLLAVPKIDAVHGHTPPFPVVLAGHDLGGSRLDPILSVAGTFAQYGLATIAIDGYGQGLALDSATELQVRAALHDAQLDDFATALFTTRARDLDGDGVADSGGDLFSPRGEHTRDLLRQTVIDWLQLSRVLRSFTGNSEMTLPTQNSPAVAGDFNQDGTPDVGGPDIWPADVSFAGNILFHGGDANPGGDQFAFGTGMGGAVAAIFAAVEPSVRAAAPISAPGGLSSIALRSSDPRIQAGQLLAQMGPFIATCNFSLSAQACGDAADAQPALVWDGSVAGRERQLGIAPLTLNPGDQLIACDLDRAPGAIPSDALLAAAPPAFCAGAIADANGNARVPLAADGPELLLAETPQGPGLPAQVDSLLIREGDRVRVIVVHGGAAGSSAQLESIDSFQLAGSAGALAYVPGSTLRAPASGLGADRNTPAFRALESEWQTLAESGDPRNYAPLYLAPVAARIGAPVNLLDVVTLGDAAIPTSTQFELARAAGLVPVQPDAQFGESIDQLLIDSAAVEGVARLPRFESPAAGPLEKLPGHFDCSSNDCSAPVVADPGGLACGNGTACTDGLAAPRLLPPLFTQLQRQTDPSGLHPGESALELADFSRTGGHGLRGPQPQNPFDLDLFLANQIGRYFETRGVEIHGESCQARLASCAWNDYPPPY